MANQNDEMRPVYVEIPREVRAPVSGYPEKLDCLPDLTTVDLLVQVRGRIGPGPYPSWGVVVDYVVIEPMRADGRRAQVHFVIGTTNDLRCHLRSRMNPAIVNKIRIRVPGGEQSNQSCIFIIGACWEN